MFRLIHIILVLCISISALVQAQTNRTMTSSGSYATVSNWSGNNIANTISENAILPNNRTARVIGASFVVANVNAGNDGLFEVRSGSSFQVGASGNEGEFDAGNNYTLEIRGNLTIFGDLIIGDNVDFTIFSSGTLTVTGDIIISNGASMDIRGDLVTGGNVVTGNDLDLSASNAADIDIDGDFEMGNNASLDLQAATIDIGGDIESGNNLDIDAANGNQLNVGGNADFGNNAQISIAGGADFSFGGNFEGGNNLDLDMSSGTTLFIGGVTTLNNNSDVSVQGGSSITTGNDLEMGNNIDIDVSGGSDVDINGEINCSGGNQDLSVTGGSTFSAFDCNCSSSFCDEITSLPIELVYFNATLENRIIQLSWGTQMEENNDFFTIEKATAQGLWNILTTVDGKGSGIFDGLSEYTYYDDDPVLGWNYYRLKQTDIDGQFEYFDVVGVKYGLSDEEVIVSVSKQGSLYFINLSVAAPRAEVAMYDLNGRLMVLESPRASDIIQTSIPVQTASPGIYLIKVVTDGQQTVKKVFLP